MAVRVESSLFALLFRCRELYRETEGAFDITSGPLTRAWGFRRREGRLPEANELAGADPARILAAARRQGPSGEPPQAFGDGHAAERMVAALEA